MRAPWLLSIALFLLRVTAQSSSPSISSSRTPYSVETPPSRWTTGRPYTTLGLANQPTASLVTITTSIQLFPTSVGYVATGLPTTTPTTTGIEYFVDPQIADGIPGFFYVPLMEESVRQSTAYNINLTTINPVVCWYPISGNYGRLPRILFYVTIAAAVILRSHLPWLYLGALAASLTYSGAAAIHACLLIWRGPGWGELDLYPLLGILSVSGIVLVPLINWSSTIRTAGLHPENDHRPKELKELDASSRIIIIFWGFLVVVGFLSAYVALQDTSPNFKLSHWETIVESGQKFVACSPESGVLNVTAGQPLQLETDGNIDFNFFTITQEFILQNNCQSPCSNPVGGVAIFRAETDLVVLSVYERFRALGELAITAKEARTNSFVINYAQKWSYIIAYVLLQGVWTACFGRNTPSQTRTIIYGFVSRILSRNHSNHGSFSRITAQAVALMSYLWSVFIVVIAIPLLVLDITAAEIYINELPQSEAANHIGAWSPYASTGLVLFAAALAKCYPTIKWVFLQSAGNLRRSFLKLIPGLHLRKPGEPVWKHDAYIKALQGLKNIAKETGHFLFGHSIRKRLMKEWGSLHSFFINPEQQYHDYWFPSCPDYPGCHNLSEYHKKLHPMEPKMTTRSQTKIATIGTQIATINIPPSQGTDSSGEPLTPDTAPQNRSTVPAQVATTNISPSQGVDSTVGILPQHTVPQHHSTMPAQSTSS